MGHRSGLPDLVVRHDDAAAARDRIVALSRAGIDGGAIELLGRVEVVTAGRAADRQVDLGSTRAIAGRAVRGAALGAVPGAGFGVLVLALATTVTTPVLAAGAVGGAAFGVSVGALVGLLTVPTMAGSWERTFAPLVPGGVLVGIRIDGPRSRRRANRVLAGCRPGDVEEVPDLDDLPDLPPVPGDDLA